MLLFATMAMVLPFSSCSKDDEDSKDDNRKDNSDWVFKNGISQMKDDGKTVSFALNDASILLDMLGGEISREMAPLVQSLQQAIELAVFEFDYDKKDIVTAGGITVNCKDESSAKALASMFMQMEASDTEVSTDGKDVILTMIQDSEYSMSKNDVILLYKEMFASANPDEEETDVRAIIEGENVISWTINFGGVSKTFGLISITKEYGFDGEDIISHKETITCADKTTASIYADMMYSYDEEYAEWYPYTYSVKDAVITVIYDEDDYARMIKDNVVKIWADDKERAPEYDLYLYY